MKLLSDLGREVNGYPFCKTYMKVKRCVEKIAVIDVMFNDPTYLDKYPHKQKSEFKQLKLQLCPKILTFVPKYDILRKQIL